MSQRKKISQATASWQLSQATFPDGTVKRGKVQSPPFLPSIKSAPSILLKTRKHIVTCCFALYPFLLLFKELQPFHNQSPHHHSLRKKFVQHENFKWMKKLIFVLERIKSQTTYKNFGKAIFYTRKFFKIKKHKLEIAKFRENARNTLSFHKSIHSFMNFLWWLKKP